MSKWNLRTVRAVVVMNSWSVVTWGHVLIQKLPALGLTLALFTHTCIMVRPDSWSAFVHWRNKQQPEFPVCYIRCLQNKMFIYIKPWIFLYPRFPHCFFFFFLSLCPTIFSSLHPQPHTSVIIKPSAGRSEAQHGKTAAKWKTEFTLLHWAADPHTHATNVCSAHSF